MNTFQEELILLADSRLANDRSGPMTLVVGREGGWEWLEQNGCMLNRP